MNIKKIQGRIPMNIKKIIPISLVAMSVMGSFTACSDNKVVGADEQTNTMAELSSSSIEPGSSNSMNITDQLKAVSRPNIAAAVFISDDDVFVDTINARENFENVVRAIIDDDSVRLTMGDSVGWHTFAEMHTLTNLLSALQDENGVIHGPIEYGRSFYMPSYDSTRYSFGKHVACNLPKKLDTRIGQIIDNPYDQYHFGVNQYDVGMNIYTRDSVVLEQFKQDCAAENGTLQDYIGKSTYLADTQDELVVESTRWACSIPKTQRTGDNLYKDPYWEKYASFIIENCKSESD